MKNKKQKVRVRKKKTASIDFFTGFAAAFVFQRVFPELTTLIMNKLKVHDGLTIAELEQLEKDYVAEQQYEEAEKVKRLIEKKKTDEAIKKLFGTK